LSKTGEVNDQLQLLNKRLNINATLDRLPRFEAIGDRFPTDRMTLAPLHPPSVRGIPRPVPTSDAKRRTSGSADRVR
jgi:hypothetical protein